MADLRIWKFRLEDPGTQDVIMPEFAEILCVQEQFGGLYLWALCNPDNSNTPRKITVCSTGHPLSQHRRRYVGTVQLLGGKLVLHVFEGE